MSKFTSKSELSKAKNYGAAHEGTHHWIAQRATAIANIPLTIWFVYSVLHLLGKGAYAVGKFFDSGLNATLMALVIISSFYHAALGLQVVVEDYVQSKAKKIVALFVIKGGLLALAVYTLLAIAKLNLS